MRYYIIAGEASGDLHASSLVKELKKLDSSSIFRGWGGNLMHNQGVELVMHYRDISFMGFAEVILNLKTIIANLNFCKNDILSFKPDVVILVDYPGFNLRIADFARKNGFRVFYYISPQLWAWNVSRVNKIKKNVDRMFVILPFEKEFYAKYEVNVDFVGHPLLDALDGNITSSDVKGDHIIAILPGSRKQEIRKMLPVMLSVTPYFENYKFLIAGMSSVGKEYYKKFTSEYKIEILFDDTYNLLKKADAALVTSGTATLETAILNIPEVVCYRANSISYLLARLLAKVNFIALPNLIAGREVVRELIQKQLNTGNLVNELKKLLIRENAASMQLGYAGIRKALGQSGASEKAASLMINYLSNNNIRN